MRTVVVTGSASGIGRATKELLEQRGDRVIGVDIRDADITVDLTTPQGRTDLVEQVRALSGGTIDAVIANAGLAHESPATIAVNYFGAVATLEGLRPLLLGSPAPHASLTSSMASLMPNDTELVGLALVGDEAGALLRCEELIKNDQGALIYGSSKSALSRWMRRVAATPEWAGAGIPLNGVGPGIVVTPMTEGMLSTEEARAALATQVPMPLHGFIGPEAVARLHAWLISDENTHVCGQIVFIDGGSDVVIRGDSTW